MRCGGYFRSGRPEKSVFEEVTFAHNPDGSVRGSHEKVQGKSMQGKRVGQRDFKGTGGIRCRSSDFVFAK